MRLGIEELLELENDVRDTLNNELEHILIKLNASGELEAFLKLIGMNDYFDNSNYSNANGKIIVIGQSEVSKDKLIGVAKNLGLNKDRFEFYLEYEDAKTANLSKTRHSSNYSCILVGPMPHSGEEKGEYSSIITSLENKNNGYPPVVRMGRNGLKITKTSFRESLEYILANEIVVA